MRILLDLLLQERNGVDELLRPRGASRNIDVHWDHLIDGNESVVREHAGRGGAGAHGDDPLGFGHLLVQAADDGSHLVRDASGDDHEIGLTRRTAHDFGAEARNVEARADHRHHFNGAAGQAKAHGPNGVFASPVDGLIDGRQDQVFAEGVDLGFFVDAREELGGLAEMKFRFRFHGNIISRGGAKEVLDATSLLHGREKALGHGVEGFVVDVDLGVQFAHFLVGELSGEFGESARQARFGGEHALANQQTQTLGCK